MPVFSRIVVPLLLSVFFLGARANADVLYAIDFDSAVYNVNPGDVFSVDLLLRETVTGGDTARLAVGGADGIFSFGTTLDYSAVTGGASGAAIGAVGDITLNEIDFDDVALNDVSLDMGLKQATMSGFSLAPDGAEVAETAPGSGIYEIGLATIEMTASGVAGEETTLSLLDLDDFFDDTVFADGFAADASLTFGSASVLNAGGAAVPEPSSVAFFGLSGLAFLGHRCRRKRKLLQPPSLSS